MHGRNRQTWADRLALDVWYVDHRTFALDLRILALTARQLLRPADASADGHATMPRFTGTAA